MGLQQVPVAMPNCVMPMASGTNFVPQQQQGFTFAASQAPVKNETVLYP